MVPNLDLAPAHVRRLRRRVRLRDGLDRMSRAVDAAGAMVAMDRFEMQALNLLTNPEIKAAFDLSREDPKLRDRYGRHRWGQQCLMARRLVEAGVELITTTFDGAQCGRDHWPRANSMLFAGGGIETSQIIGATDARGEDVTERRVAPGDFLATLYQHLGINAAQVTIPDFARRPTPIVTIGNPILELQPRA